MRPTRNSHASELLGGTVKRFSKIKKAYSIIADNITK